MVMRLHYAVSSFSVCSLFYKGESIKLDIIKLSRFRLVAARF
jgi:hypothetical protein